MKHTFASALVVCEIGCGIDSTVPAGEYGAVNTKSEELQFHPNWNSCAPPTACLSALQCGTVPVELGPEPVSLVSGECGPDKYCCIPPPPPGQPPAYFLALHDIQCLFPDDEVGYDEPRLYVNGNLVWSHEHFAVNETANLTGVPHKRFDDSGFMRLQLQEWDAWPGSTVTLHVENDGRVYSTDGSDLKSVEFGDGSLFGAHYVVNYRVFFE